MYNYKTHLETINLKSYQDSINVWFFGDIHRDVESCDVDRWKWFLKKAAQDDPENTYYFGMGDYHDFASDSEKKKIRDLHETTLESFDNLVQRRNRAFAIETKQMRGKLLGLMGGNHTWYFMNGKTSDEDLAERMDCPYLGWLSHYTIRFFLKNISTSILIHIVACHGKAGGKTQGVTINQVAELKDIFPIADIYIMGHDHQRAAKPTSILYPTCVQNGEVKIKQKRQFLCRSGAFKKTYQEDSCGYEIKRLLKPSDLGALKLNIAFHRPTKANDPRTLIPDITALL